MKTYCEKLQSHFSHDDQSSMNFPKEYVARKGPGDVTVFLHLASHLQWDSHVVGSWIRGQLLVSSYKSQLSVQNDCHLWYMNYIQFSLTQRSNLQVTHTYLPHLSHPMSLSQCCAVWIGWKKNIHLFVSGHSHLSLGLILHLHALWYTEHFCQMLPKPQNTKSFAENAAF